MGMARATRAGLRNSSKRLRPKSPEDRRERNKKADLGTGLARYCSILCCFDDGRNCVERISFEPVVDIDKPFGSPAARGSFLDQADAGVATLGIQVFYFVVR